ncbi:hypothetical protein G6F24_014827 [Rhizopus arrhizus]|nr:hypothetical protein G6F24_014827 [Rhizopus arrhizus]
MAAGRRAGRPDAAGAAVPAGRLRLGGGPLVRTAAAAAGRQGPAAGPDGPRGPVGGHSGLVARPRAGVAGRRCKRRATQPAGRGLPRRAGAVGRLAGGRAQPLRHLPEARHRIPDPAEHHVQVDGRRAPVDDRKPPGPAQRVGLPTGRAGAAQERDPAGAHASRRQRAARRRVG